MLHSAADRFDPACNSGRRSEGVLVSCTDVGSAFQRGRATAHRAHTKGSPLRTILVVKDNKGDFVFYICPSIMAGKGT